MNIGFDAKRAYHNTTGLGNYSRTLIRSLSEYYPQHEYFLFNPKSSDKYHFSQENLHEIKPEKLIHKIFSSAWRSKYVIDDLKKNNIDIYHGLSHEIPVGIQNTNIRSVVTMHDLIHERYPEQYKAIDVKIYSRKFRYACNNADKVIAVSEQTKKDVIDFYHVPSEKIEVCYQSCDPAFGVKLTTEEKLRATKHFNLPDNYFLYVGSVIERKNLLTICKAMYSLQNELSIPLVVVGDGGKYKEQVKKFIAHKNLTSKVIFLSEQFSGADIYKNLPALYQSALALIYPSVFEGFGIPVLEALWSGIPVITSSVSCMPETGGDAALYIDPSDFVQLADAMLKIYADNNLRTVMIAKGYQHAQSFSQQKCAEAVMKVYQNL